MSFTRTLEAMDLLDRPDAPTKPQEPVPFMGSPVDMATMNKEEVDPEMDAILVIDTTRGNRANNHNGFAISPTVTDGYILRVSEDLFSIMEIVTGELPVVFPITIQDIKPYGNGLYHLHSILQPSTAARVPCVGVAIISHSAVPGYATSETHATDIDSGSPFQYRSGESLQRRKMRFLQQKRIRADAGYWISLWPDEPFPNSGGKKECIRRR